MKKRISVGWYVLAILIPITIAGIEAHAQQDSSNVRFAESSVSESAKMSVSVPLGNYQGLGLDLPVSLNYSSSVWNIDYLATVTNHNTHNYNVKQTIAQAVFAKHSTSGWKSSLDLPTIEFPRSGEKYNYKGQPTFGSGCTQGDYRISHVTIHMPDGSTHELRKSDTPVAGGGVDMSGQFYAVDGSRIRFDASGTADTGTIYMPDGTRYILGHPTSQIIDKFGNTLSYNENDRKWTDTLGREIFNPLPALPEARDYAYTLPGLAGVGNGLLTYTFRWKELQDVLSPVEGSTPALNVIASHYLPDPLSAPTGDSSTNFPQTQASPAPSLFQSSQPTYDEDPLLPVPTLVVGKSQSGGQLFNPVVLSEIILPDGRSYKFSYNVYGEIDKVTYPTGAYDKYEHRLTVTEREGYDQPYTQAQRNINKREQSDDATGSAIREWTYFEDGNSYGMGNPYGDTTLLKRTSIIAPDRTRTEIFTIEATTAPALLGLADSRVGNVAEKRWFSTSTDGRHGELLRREISEYEQTTNAYPWQSACNSTSYSRPISATRNPRLKKTVSILFEGSGPALAQTRTFSYGATTYQYSTGLDQVQENSYHFAVVSNSSPTDVAQSGTLSQIPTGSLAKYTATEYVDDPNYRDANILGVPRTVTIYNGFAPYAVVSRSEIVYDECPQYCTTTGRALPTSLKTWDSSKGSDPSNAANQLVTHAKFDQWGNRVEATDAKGFVTTTVYDSIYHTFAISVISPIPDPNPSQNPDGLPHGSQTAFTTTTTYDTPQPNKPPLGLVVATMDANGQSTTISYVDPITGFVDALLRPRKVTAPNGHQTITEYGSGIDEGTRWVKVRMQIDTEKWSEVISEYDGLGRTIFTKKIDSQGNIGTRTEYDLMGRVLRSSNPYRLDASDNPAQGETIQWTTPEYDDLGRTEKVVSADNDDVQIAYALSTTSVIGTTKTITDQAGQKRAGITDAFGNMIRVIEDPGPNQLATDYVFDALGNLRRTIQGEQNRYFMYDSLGRVLFAKQPEQDTNSALIATDPITGNSNWSAGYTFDNNGNILTTTDAKNVLVTATYDQLDRIKTRDYSDPATPDVSFYYDGTGLGVSPPNFSKGKTTRVASSVSETRNTSFDSMGRLLTSEQRSTAEQIAGTQAPYAFAYVYNLSGALVEETYPSGRVVKNTLNADGELSQVQSKKSSSFGFFTYANSFTYNSSGAVTKMQLGNGRWETAVYNERQQVTQLGLGTTDGNQDLLKLEFKYTTSPTSADNNGSMREQKITVPTVGANAEFTATQTYTYDSLNRIQSATENLKPVGGTETQTWKQTFDIDRYGNRRFDAANTTTLGSCDPSVCNPEINTSDNRLKKDQVGGTSVDYDYDANGALLKDFNGQRFSYDAESHQKEFFSASNQTTTPDARYEYDGEGRRVKKIAGSEMTIFVYDASGELAAEYSTTVVAEAQAKVSYLTTDHLGSPRVITDQNGSVISRKDFSTFGEEVTSSKRVGGVNGNGYDAPNVRQDYTGYQKDYESGLEFAQARYFNSQHGRFTSVDPLAASAAIRNPQTFNRYSYGLNSPYKFTDPLGLMFGTPNPDSGIYITSDPTLTSKLDRVWAYYFRGQQTPPQSTAQQNQQSSTDTFDFVKERREYSFTATQTNPKTRVVAQIKFDVVEEDVDVYENGTFVKSVLNVSVIATNGPNAVYKLTQTLLNNNAGPAAKAVIEGAILKGFDKTLLLGIAAKETFFGTVKGTKDSSYNPTQYRSGLNDGRKPSSNIGDNVSSSVDLYRQKEGMARSTNPSVVLDYYRGRGIEPTYATTVLNYQNEIGNGINATISKRGNYFRKQ